MEHKASPERVTRLLAASGNGDQKALAELLPLVYDELRGLADRYLRRERRDHTLQPTALVNEAYLKLVGQLHVPWQNRNHFFAMAATAMRRILVNHAKSRQRIKRGGQRRRVPLDRDIPDPIESEPDLLALDEALKALATLDERKARLVELRFFAGLGIEETAQALGVSPATVKREWILVRAWLYSQISKGDGP